MVHWEEKTLNLNKTVVMAIIVGSLVGAYMWYGPTFWDWVQTTYGLENSAFTYSFGAGVTVVVAFLIARMLTYGMGKKN